MKNPSALRAEAHIFLNNGNWSAAVDRFESLLQILPNDVEALNQTAINALQTGKWQGGIDRLQRATAIEPSAVASWSNLGVAYSQVEEWSAAAHAFRQALNCAPNQHEIKLLLGVALYRSDDRWEAVTSFNEAMLGAQSEGKWRSPDTVPTHLHEALALAMKVLSSYESEWINESVSSLEKRHGKDALRRVQRCVDGYLRILELTPDVLQRPKFLFFPDLPATPYLDRSCFHWIEALEADAAAIRSELLENVMFETKQPFLQLSVRSKLEDYLGGKKPDWSAYFFYRHGQIYSDHLLACPQTAKRLEQVPLVSVPGNAPEVLFSFLGPSTHILPHTGVTNTRVVAHLPLVIPEKCALSVAGNVHVWKEGRCVIFDDTYEHEAWNWSEQARAVLILDVWNPHLTSVECEAVAALVPVMEKCRHVVSATSDSRSA